MEGNQKLVRAFFFAMAHKKPLLLVGIQIRPIDPSNKVIPAVRLFLVGFSGIYDLWDFTYLLIIMVVSNLCATLSSAATAPCE